MAEKILRMERRVDTKVETFVNGHRVIGAVMTLIGAPLVMMAVVSLCTMAVTLPFSWLWG